MLSISYPVHPVHPCEFPPPHACPSRAAPGIITVMPAKNEDLHGNVPDTSPVALLLIDVINDMEFDTGEQLLKHALPMARRLADFKRRAKEAGIATIYVNDNFGRWQSDFNKLLSHCLEDKVCGKELAEILKPEEDDYFVLKPKHSG